MSDKIFFESGNLLVTNTRFQVDNESYIIRNVTSVKVNVTPGKKGRPATTSQELVIINMIGFIVFFCIGLLTLSISIGYVLIFVAIVGVLSPENYKNKPAIPDEPDTYELILKTAGGEIKAFVSQDKILMDNLVQALNDAFDYGG